MPTLPTEPIGRFTRPLALIEPAHDAAIRDTASTVTAGGEQRRRHHLAHALRWRSGP